ncbi:hypothetical protein TraAM80_00756 [Trypanosoma rangeli]|uniref:Uncharacterized protein n=1 Tax=Trypanosoma rangeli TaxID=5698 RepID=A0A3R7RRZ9_TRYRA|nr:uncharacterized protein TraAM80_00756 [Trypanosoma rangeli]RNF11673.1 hypothetical protein TraAM80_00756 [Trypanosoma rangeli]|eukprot:RNF11673.1 hypothetical protein TraAM80_00756 [Trypanosoma rangeli]
MKPSSKSQLSNEDDEKCLLANLQYRLSLHCCRVLAQLTAHTGKSFLTLAKRGRSPPRSEAEGEHAEDAGKCDEFSMHEEAYRSVLSAIAASCTLGHRSCHALWGPRGCGKHRILRLVAKEFRQRERTLVFYLDGDTLNGDEDGLRSIADQLLDFLKRPQSAQLRAADWSLRTGSFDFGSLFGFSKLLQQDLAESEVQESDDDSSNLLARKRAAANRQKKSGKENDKKATRKRARPQSPVDSESEGGKMDGEEGLLLMTSTMALATGGVSSALPALQRALLLMKSYGTNLVICIRRVERFGIWCDQLLYVLSGLMHESDGRGGGMSLVMTSSTPDIRQLEKRLSSRLTCETRCIPLLPWTASRVARACLVEVRESLQHRIERRVALTKNKGRNKKSSASEVPLGTEMDSLVPPHTGWSFDVLSGAQEVVNQQVNTTLCASTASPSHLTQLLEETMLGMLTAVLTEMDDVSRAEHESVEGAVFVRRVARVSKDLRSIAATAGRVVASVSSVFGEVCSGRLVFLNEKSRRGMLLWLKSRLKESGSDKSLRETFATAPEAVRTLWLSTSSEKPARNARKAAAAMATTAASPSPLCRQPLLFDDLLTDCRLVELGYCSREAFFVLLYVYLRHEAGVARTVVDLLEDVSSSMGTQAAAALDRAAFHAAIAALSRWRVLSVAGRSGTGVVSLRGSSARLREFLQSVLRQANYCGSVLGLEAKELTRLRSLV